MTGRVVVLGGGHNGLVAAALLARAGLRPLLLERRDVVGGAAVTEEFAPGFRASTLAHTAGPLRPAVEKALGLGGLGWTRPSTSLWAPALEGPGLAIERDPAATAAGIRALSPRDAERYPAFHRSLTRVAGLLARVADTRPPDLEARRWRELARLAPLGLSLLRLGRQDGQRLLRWLPMAVADFASEWFETEILEAVVAGRGVLGSSAGPWSAGTTANLLFAAAADPTAGLGSCVLLRGGLGALAEGLAGAARRHGAEIRLGASAEHLLVREGRVTGVVLAGGEEIPARAVVSTVDPHRTFLDLLEPEALDPEELHRIRTYRIRGMVAKVHLALGELPRFKSLGEADARERLAGRIHLGASIEGLERGFDDAKYGRLAERPYLEATVPTLSDPGLAPEGRHVMSLYVQYAPHRLAEGSWDDRREELGDAVLKVLEDYAPGISSLVLHRQVVTPRDLEATYGLTGGHPSHGETSLNQIFAFRPLIGWASYKGPVAGLYLGGAGSHPGGGVTGAPAAIAVRTILKELR